MIVDTEISWGYKPMLEIFADANNLELKFEPYHADKKSEYSDLYIGREYTRIIYEDNSETACSITFMSYRHLGFENMLCDYLIRCHIPAEMIPIGKAVMRKTDEQLEEEWQEHKRKIGLR